VRRQSGTSVGFAIVRRAVTGADEQGASVAKVWGVGEPVVLNGSRLSWHDESGQPCTVVSAVVGAERRRS
jgi:hypothetical protein